MFVLVVFCIKPDLFVLVAYCKHEQPTALTAHPDVPLISFTGGTATGERIAQVGLQ
jgi:acyl-CoA reductase-like NAD-dependent aldehyde dehydrogenase